MKFNYFVYLIFCGSISGCDYPNWNYDSFRITATYNSNKLCSFEVDGVKLSDNEYKQSISESGRCIGCTEGGLDGYFISCRKNPTTPPDGFIQYPPVLIIHVVIPKGSNLNNGVYQVTEVGGRVKNITTTASLLRHPEYGHSSLLNGITGAKLVGVSGSLKLQEDYTYVEKGNSQKAIAGIEGKLSITAERRAAGF